MDNTREYLKTAVINITDVLGANTIIAAPTVAGNFLAIDFISFKVTTDNTVTFKSATTALSGPIPLSANDSLTWENAIKNSNGVITCAPNEAFVIALSALGSTAGMVRYREVGF